MKEGSPVLKLKRFLPDTAQVGLAVVALSVGVVASTSDTGQDGFCRTTLQNANSQNLGSRQVLDIMDSNNCISLFNGPELSPLQIDKISPAAPMQDSRQP